jgi:hypothetical protein
MTISTNVNSLKLQGIKEKYEKIYQKIEKNKSKIKKLRELNNIKKQMKFLDFNENKNRILTMRVRLSNRIIFYPRNSGNSTPPTRNTPTRKEELICLCKPSACLTTRCHSKSARCCRHFKAYQKRRTPKEETSIMLNRFLTRYGVKDQIKFLASQKNSKDEVLIDEGDNISN